MSDTPLAIISKEADRLKKENQSLKAALEKITNFDSGMYATDAWDEAESIAQAALRDVAAPSGNDYWSDWQDVPVENE